MVLSVTIVIPTYLLVTLVSPVSSHFAKSVRLHRVAGGVFSQKVDVIGASIACNCRSLLHYQPLSKIHRQVGSFHLLAVDLVKSFGLAHREIIPPTSLSSFPQVHRFRPDVRLWVFLHGGQFRPCDRLERTNQTPREGT